MNTDQPTPQQTTTHADTTTPQEPTMHTPAANNDAAKVTAAQLDYSSREKNSGPMWLLWLFTGGIGGHRYYLGDTGYALGMTFTLGGLGFWTLIDAFLIGGRRRDLNDQARREAFARHGIAV